MITPRLSPPYPLRVFVPAPDWNHPAGGVRKMYRHVDVLNAHGIPAFIVHNQPGFRCTWFQNQTPVTCSPELRPTDILLAAERIAWQLMLTTPGVRKVVFNQGAYHYSATSAVERIVGGIVWRRRCGPGGSG